MTGGGGRERGRQGWRERAAAADPLRKADVDDDDHERCKAPWVALSRRGRGDGHIDWLYHWKPESQTILK